MEFEGNTSANPRIPKELLTPNGKPVGPFAIRDNAIEYAEKVGYKYVRVPVGYGSGWSYYAIPLNMDENFNIIN